MHLKMFHATSFKDSRVNYHIRNLFAVFTNDSIVLFLRFSKR